MKFLTNNQRIIYVKLFIYISTIIYILFSQPSRALRLNIANIDIGSYVLFGMTIITSGIVVLFYYNLKKKDMILGLKILIILMVSIVINIINTGTISNIKYMFNMIINLYVFYFIYISIIRDKKILKIIAKTLSYYIIVLFILLVLSIVFYKQEVLHLFFDISTYTHASGGKSYLIYDALKFEKVFFGKSNDEVLFDGIQLAVYPFVYIFFFQILKYLKYQLSTIENLAFILSIIIVIMYTSRGMLMSLFTMGIFLIINSRKILKILLYLILFFPFIVFFLDPETLRGREPIIILFLSKLTLLGNGIGSSINDLEHFTEVYKSDYSLSKSFGSFHNIHLEFIYNFGILPYLMLITSIFVMIKRINTIKELKILSFIIIFSFIYLGTNGNIFDFYFILFISIFISLLSIYHKHFKVMKNNHITKTKRRKVLKNDNK